MDCAAAHQDRGRFLALLDAASWKASHRQMLSGIAIIFPVLMVVWMFFMPRSPVYLITKGQV